VFVFMPALRGENGLPGDFSGFYDETADVLAAADVLRGQPGVDPARLFLAGHSHGSLLAQRPI
jgi:dipeptidyl aminopeptidase/acylaminoacyl peptidase